MIFATSGFSRPSVFFADGERALIEAHGLIVFALLVVEASEVVQLRHEPLAIAAIGLFLDGERLLVERDRVGVTAQSFIDHAEIVQGHGIIGVGLPVALANDVAELLGVARSLLIAAGLIAAAERLHDRRRVASLGDGNARWQCHEHSCEGKGDVQKPHDHLAQVTPAISGPPRWPFPH